jgi:hypothetical protein
LVRPADRSSERHGQGIHGAEVRIRRRLKRFMPRPASMALSMSMSKGEDMNSMSTARQ